MAMVLRSDASSSMTSAQSCFNYDVFLSFRGEDTRTNFTDHLYTTLKQVGIRTFRDDDAMERGRILGPELETAILQSKISIIVFSRNYASSKWCLEEVLTIIKEQERLSSKHEVVPVFYNVDPSDVRNQTGSFEEAFTRYEDTIEAEKVKKWRDSLRKAATLTGMVLHDHEHEAEFISKIANVIRKKLDYQALYIEDNLVGIKKDVDRIDLWLQDPSPDAIILLIEGMGGIGKTTLAKCIYNSNYHEYDSSCFLADISFNSNKLDGLLGLQKQLVSRISKEETIWNVDEGINKVTHAICSKKVLVILDDVSKTQQLEALLGRQRFYPGSKVIITTRHKWPLNAFKVPHKVHTLKELVYYDSIQLFSMYASSQQFPIESYTVQTTERLVRYCGGLPLALKVLGSSLYGNTNEVWEGTIRKLEAISNPDIQKVLQISYDNLGDDKDKELFLHVACFFMGEEKDYIVKLLDECDLFPVVGIKNLMDRCLLYVDKHGRVMMHHLIKEMGREVVRQESPIDPGKRTRLWHHKDCFNVLQDVVGTENVEGLMLDMQKFKEAKVTRKRSFEEYVGKTMHGNDVNFEIGALEKMTNLMFLQLNYATFFGECKNLPKKLRLLCWHGFSLNAIPSGIPMEKLVVLDMSYSKLKLVWDDFKVIRSLKILNLSYSVELIGTPDFRGLLGLESLILKGCSSLVRVHESIACLERLVLLDISDCRSLRDIPCLTTSLVSLQMSSCTNLGRVQCLDSVTPFSLLKKLNISNCNLFDNSFPNDWSSLVSLYNLFMDGNNVTSLPKCIQTLPELQYLSVKNCSQIQSVLGVPKSVYELNAGGNKSLERVQLADNLRTTVDILNCQNMCEIEGRYKLQSIEKVERKIIRYLGLQSLAAQGMELALHKVLFENGIFSTFVSEKQIPSSCSFTYKERGPKISFKVPWHHNSSRITAFNMSVVFSNLEGYASWRTEVYNKTKKVLWKYDARFIKASTNMEKCAYLSVWRCGNLLEAGDEILIRIIDEYKGTQFEAIGELEIEECGIRIIYEDEEEVEDGEINEAHDHVNVFDQISWTDRTAVEISDYVHSGKMYRFTTNETLMGSIPIEPEDNSGLYTPP